VKKRWGTSKAKQGIDSLLPISREVFSHFLESNASTCTAVTWEDKHHSSECPLFILLPSAFIAEHDAIWYGISLWSVGVSCLGYVLSASCTSPAYLLGAGSMVRVGGRKGSDTVQVLFSNS